MRWCLLKRVFVSVARVECV